MTLAVRAKRSGSYHKATAGPDSAGAYTTECRQLVVPAPGRRSGGRTYRATAEFVNEGEFVLSVCEVAGTLIVPLCQTCSWRDGTWHYCREAGAFVLGSLQGCPADHSIPRRQVQP